MPTNDPNPTSSQYGYGRNELAYALRDMADVIPALPDDHPNAALSAHNHAVLLAAAQQLESPPTSAPTPARHGIYHLAPPTDDPLLRESSRIISLLTPDEARALTDQLAQNPDDHAAILAGLHQRIYESPRLDEWQSLPPAERINLALRTTALAAIACEQAVMPTATAHLDFARLACAYAADTGEIPYPIAQTQPRQQAQLPAMSSPCEMPINPPEPEFPPRDDQGRFAPYLPTDCPPPPDGTYDANARILANRAAALGDRIAMPLPPRFVSLDHIDPIDAPDAARWLPEVRRPLADAHIALTTAATAAAEHGQVVAATQIDYANAIVKKLLDGSTDPETD